MEAQDGSFILGIKVAASACIRRATGITTSIAVKAMSSKIEATAKVMVGLLERIALALVAQLVSSFMATHTVLAHMRAASFITILVLAMAGSMIVARKQRYLSPTCSLKMGKIVVHLRSRMDTKVITSNIKVLLTNVVFMVAHRLAINVTHTPITADLLVYTPLASMATDRKYLHLRSDRRVLGSIGAAGMSCEIHTTVSYATANNPRGQHRNSYASN